MRDVLVFQAKLFVDGVKDIVLAPVSLAAAVIGIVTDRERPGRLLYGVLQGGRTFDRWVDLFGAEREARARQALPPTDADADAAVPASVTDDAQGFDALVQRMEHALVEQVRRGGVTAKAKDAFDQAMDALHERRKPPPPRP